MQNNMKIVALLLFVAPLCGLSQEFNGDLLGASKDEIIANHPDIKSRFAEKDSLSIDHWYHGTKAKKEFLAYYGKVGGYPVRFEYWFYDGDFLEGIYDFTQNHPDPEQRTAVSSTAIHEILQMKYGKPSEVVGNITIWKIFERVKYTIELMVTANQSPQILYRWNRRADAWHRKEIKSKSKDF